jgi:murein DD-endopeptidase MepM/ murein hydrolase activator NlpD
VSTRSQGASRRGGAVLRAQLAAAPITVLLCVALAAVAVTARPAPAVASSAAPPFVPALTAPLPGVSSNGALAVTPKPGSGGWYWPIGSEDFGSYAGFLTSRGATVHVAQDMHAPQGHPVYAIGDGTVWISRADTGGYGVNGTPGGCVIIVHRTAAGEEFRALYGHLSDLRFKAGAHVSGGDVIGVTNGCDHVHFGIHPSAVYRGGNPYAGEVPKTWTDHGGWVDPVTYLRTHPHSATYSAPALPLVKITTDVAPHDFGAAAGVASTDIDLGLA